MFLSACFVLYSVIIACVPFPFGVWVRLCNLVVSVPDHCLFIYLDGQESDHAVVDDDR